MSHTVDAPLTRPVTPLEDQDCLVPHTQLRPPVLLVEDDPIVVTVVTAMLESEGYPVRVAPDGPTALIEMRRSPMPLVISDWMMPGMEGVELCRQLRDDESLGFFYFIMLTSRSTVEDRVKAFEQGVDDFLSKPVEPQELIARLHAARRVIALEANLAQQNRHAHRLNAELAMMNQRLAYAASHDGLTGVLNRAAGQNRLDKLWHEAALTAKPLSVLMLDLDKFKQVNDTLGHQAGDELLRWVCRVVDRVIGDDAMLCRFGGDEFLVICPGRDRDGARMLAHEIRDAVSQGRARPGWQQEPTSLSIGVAQVTGAMHSVDDLIREADADLYANKRKSRAA